MKKLTRRDFIKISAIGAGAIAIGGIGIAEVMATPKLKTYSQTQALLGTFVTIKVRILRRMVLFADTMMRGIQGFLS